MKTSIYYICMGLLLSLFIGSCTSRHERNKEREAAQQRLIQEHIENRRIAYIDNERKNCKRDFYSKAISIVDSILLLDARKRLDTIPKPIKVERPDRPEIMEFIDSSELKPLFDSLSFSPQHQHQKEDSTESPQQIQD